MYLFRNPYALNFSKRIMTAAEFKKEREREREKKETKKEINF